MEKMIEIPDPIFDFIQSKIQVENIPFLPYFYPSPENFIAFQEGYRYNPTTGENLIGNTIGWWKKDWYAIASTYSNDPFIIKLNTNKNYPVYFAWHSTSKWEPF